MNKVAVFLDRDGTIIEDRDYLHRPEEVVFVPGAAAALKRLQVAGFSLVMVTNQSGVGRGYFTLADVHRVYEHIASQLLVNGVKFDRIYIAPEHPDALAAALERLLGDPELRRRLGVHAREVAVARFGTDVMCRAYEALYGEIAGG